MWELVELIKMVQGTQVQIRGKWVPARQSVKLRLWRLKKCTK
jgi:hypothetical protein